MVNAPVTLAMTGASGAAYGLRLLEVLLRQGEAVYFLLSKPAHQVIFHETGLHLPSRARDIQRVLAARFQAAPGQLQVFGREDWNAPLASGGGAPRAMVICPCTSGTLAAVACGYSRSLLERAADVVLKEQRKLVLVHRETPLSVIHLENMLRLARLGAVVLPANPGFYHGPRTLEDLVDFIVARVLEHLGLTQTLIPTWGAPSDE